MIITALAFDFTNGFHDTANAMATSIATGALRPKVAVAISAVLNLAGAFLSVEVAKTISGGIVDEGKISPAVIFGGLVGAIIWNLVTWLLGRGHRRRHLRRLPPGPGQRRQRQPGPRDRRRLRRRSMHVNWSGLGEVFVIALGAGVSVVVLFSLGITALGRRATARESAAMDTSVAAVCFLACVAVVGYGIYLVVAK